MNLWAPGIASPAQFGRACAGLALGLLLGCAPAPRVRHAEAHDLLEQLANQTSCSRSVVGDAQLVLSGPFVHVSGHLLYRVQAPDNLRFDLYSSLGVTLSTLATDGKKFALYDLAQNQLVYGPPKTCNLARFTRVAVPAFALVELLRGRPPVLAHASQPKLRYARSLFESGRYVLVIEGEHRTKETIEIEVAEEDLHKPLAEQRLRLRSVRVKQAGRVLYKVELEGHQARPRARAEATPEELELGLSPPPPSGPPCDAELPTRIHFSVDRKGYRLSLENKEVFHNPPLAPGVYGLEVPAGASVLHSDCR